MADSVTTPPEVSATPSAPVFQLQLEEDNLCLQLPLPSATDPSPDWPTLEQTLRDYLQLQGDRWPKETPVHLWVADRLLDVRQLQSISNLLKDIHLNLQSVKTSRRQTAIAAVTLGCSVEQISATPLKATLNPPTAKPLVIKQTIRSGSEIRHNGDVIILGDVNSGGEIIADGDIVIWGTLRGTVHAGANGNEKATVSILRLAPSQIRIADLVARLSAEDSTPSEPEVAYITPDGIRLSPASQFKKRK